MTTHTTPQKFIRPGFGFDVGQDFARAKVALPVTLAESEYAKPGCVIGYISEQPDSKLGFLRIGHQGKVRVHVMRDAVSWIEPTIDGQFMICRQNGTSRHYRTEAEAMANL
jgi:hypothetical protein